MTSTHCFHPALATDLPEFQHWVKQDVQLLPTAVIILLCSTVAVLPGGLDSVRPATHQASQASKCPCRWHAAPCNTRPPTTIRSLPDIASIWPCTTSGLCTISACAALCFVTLPLQARKHGFAHQRAPRTQLPETEVSQDVPGNILLQPEMYNIPSLAFSEALLNTLRLYTVIECH